MRTNFELMEYLPTAILDFKTDIISDELVDFKTEDENLIAYLNQLEHHLFKPYEFTLYN